MIKENKENLRLRSLLRLKALGFKGNMLKWIESFLHQRRQGVTINGVKSDWGIKCHKWSPERFCIRTDTVYIVCE